MSDSKNDNQPDRKGSLLQGLTSRMDDVTRPFPFDKMTTLKIIFKPMEESWCHPLVNLSQKLLEHHGLGNDSDNNSVHPTVEQAEVNPVKVATVNFTSLGIFVYDDEGASVDPEANPHSLVGFYRYPEHLAEKMPKLRELAIFWGNQPPHHLEKPVFPFKRERGKEDDLTYSP